MKIFTLAFASLLLSTNLSAQTLTLGNKIWWDLNDNGKKDAVEPWASSITVYLYQDNNEDGIADAGFTTKTTSTSGGGSYSFTGLAAGKYFVKVDAGYSHYVSTAYGGDPDNNIDGDNNGYRQDLASYSIFSETITLAAGTEPDGTGATNTNINNTLDIGMWKANGVGDLVWLDNNANGLQDVGEPGMANVTVNLRSKTGTLLETTTTDANGNYYFYDPMGYYGVNDYQIEFVAPTGYKSTLANKGDDAKDSDAISGLIDAVFVPFGKWDHSYDAGFVLSSVVLPVKLSSFTASLYNTKAILNWKTATEENLNYFIVEKSLDGVNFTDAGMVFATGNSAVEKSYSLAENLAAVTASIVYYRLRSVDNDGKMQLSDTRIIRLSKQNQNAITITTYPNPVTAELRISIPQEWQNKPVTYDLIAMNGQVLQSSVKSKAGQTEVLDVSKNQSGVYMLRASCGGQSATQKIVKN